MTGGVFVQMMKEKIIPAAVSAVGSWLGRQGHHSDRFCWRIQHQDVFGGTGTREEPGVAKRCGQHRETRHDERRDAASDVAPISPPQRARPRSVEQLASGSGSGKAEQRQPAQQETFSTHHRLGDDNLGKMGFGRETDCSVWNT